MSEERPTDPYWRGLSRFRRGADLVRFWRTDPLFGRIVLFMKDLSTVRGRWAPSPTGLLHLGSARTALVAWLSVRSRNGEFVWRTEDLDQPRSIPGMEEAGMRDLQWLGLDWDEGPDVRGTHDPYRQSERTELYHRALEQLLAGDHLFPCSLSRSDIREIASAPHAEVGAYPIAIRPARLEHGWFQNRESNSSIRFKIDDSITRFVDLAAGECSQHARRQCGDFVVFRKDGIFSYQLAVVVDDLAMGITEVVRGGDLLSSTARQIHLIEALGGEIPAYGHVPMATGGDGRKLSKRYESMTIAEVREAGVRPEVLCGYFAQTLGLLPDVEAVSPTELIDTFNWASIRRDDWTVPSDILEDLIRRSSWSVKTL